jgi:hypothetical protein
MLTKDNYRAFDAVNYSKLSTLSLDPSLVKRDIEPTEAMAFGSMFDCLLTDKDRFFEEYIVATVKKPTAQLGEFLDLYLQYADYNLAHEEMKARNPKLRDSVDKFKERIETEAGDYIRFLEESKDKKVVSSEDYFLANVMKESLVTNEFTEKYFNMDYNWRIEYQIPLLAEIKGIQYKVLLDMLLINDVTKEIYPIDIKTTSDYPNKFQNSVQKYNYLIQASLYWDVVQINYSDYKIHDFQFLVCSKVLPNKPYLWLADDLCRSVGKYGTSLKHMKLKGYIELAEDLKWHEETGLWEYPRSTYENGGINKIDFFL